MACLEESAVNEDEGIVDSSNDMLFSCADPACKATQSVTKILSGTTYTRSLAYAGEEMGELRVDREMRPVVVRR